MLRRNLLYTGITRSKNFLILCGEPEVFKFGIERDDDQKRLTSLADRLTLEEIPAEETENQPAEVLQDASLTTENFKSIHPLIGMAGISPYDFLEDAN